MNQPFTFTIKSSIQREQDDLEQCVSVCKGALQTYGDTYELVFKEENELGTIYTSMKCSSTSIIMKKQGGVETEMHFLLGEKTEGVYQVDRLSFPLVLTTKRIQFEYKATTLQLELDYLMIIGGEQEQILLTIEGQA